MKKILLIICLTLFLILGANSALAADCCTPQDCAEQSSTPGDIASNYLCNAGSGCTVDSRENIGGGEFELTFTSPGSCTSVGGSPSGLETIGIPDVCDVGVAPTKLPDDCGSGAPSGSQFSENFMCDLTDDAQENCGFCCMMNTIYKVTTWLFYILMLLVTIFIIYGGFIIITSSGDPEKAGKGRQILTYAVVGLAIALLARVIPSLVRFVIGV